MRNIIALAAMPEEADALFAGQGVEEQASAWTVRRVTLPHANVIIAVTGLGKVNAAMAAATLTQHYAAQMLVITGTCGKIGPAVGDCFYVADAVQHDYGARRTDGFAHYGAGDWPFGPPTLTPFAAMADPGSGLPHARMISGDCFVECGNHARGLADGLKAELVDMEVAAVAHVAARLNLPWAAIKATTDEADGDGAGDFHANLLAASARAATAMEGLLHQVLAQQ